MGSLDTVLIAEEVAEVRAFIDSAQVHRARLPEILCSLILLS